jgi:hypothetical protein
VAVIVQRHAEASGGEAVNWRRVYLEVRTIRVTFNAALGQTRALPPEQRSRAIAALVVRTRDLLKDVRDRAMENGSSREVLAAIDRAADEVDRAA